MLPSILGYREASGSRLFRFFDMAVKGGDFMLRSETKTKLTAK